MSLYSDSKIESLARLNHWKLREAFGEARNRKTVKKRDLQCVKTSEGKNLWAANQWSRRIWGKAVCDQLSEYFSYTEEGNHSGETFLVTLADISCVTSTDPASINMKAIKKKLTLGLRGMSHLGFIEPAFYVNWQANLRFTDKKCLSWHVHALVWDIPGPKLRRHIKRLNVSEKYRPVAIQLRGAHCRRIKQGELAKVVGYITKPPVHSYRLSMVDRRDENGELVVTSDGEVLTRLFQKKGKLRKGERITLFHAMKSLYLDDLAFAGGEGSKLLARVKRVTIPVA